MTKKLFSTTPTMVTTKEQRLDQRRQALEMAKAIDSANFDEKVGSELQGKIQVLKDAMTVQTIRYESYRRPLKKWMIEHGRLGSDYMLQLIPIKPTVTSVANILLLFITTMDAIYPKSVQIYYSKPNPGMQINFWTIKIQAVADMPGFERALARTLESLCDVDAWQ